MKITKRQLRQIIREAMDYDPMGDEGVPHVGVRPEYALAFIDASYGDRRMELVVDKRDAELARVVMKKLRKQGQTSGVQPTRQRFHPSEVTSRKELLRLVGEPISESIDYSYQNWWEYGLNDGRAGDPPNPPDRPLEARDAYEDGYQEGLTLRRIAGLDAPLTESAGYKAWVEERGHITPAASSVIASYLVEFGFEPDGEEARRLAQEYGVDLRNISMAARRERVERGIMGEANGGSWRDPINLPSIDSLEAAGREGMASYADIEAARYALPELEEYMEFNYRATLENAVDAYLEAHGYDDPDSPLAAAREDQREFLMRISRERGLDKI